MDLRGDRCLETDGAAFAAEGHARITGVPGVALATSGPGATNLLTAMGSCYFDSTPAVFITGQVNRNELKGDRAIRQLGFQETDIVSVARPITKAAFQVMDPADIGEALDRAFDTALSGRPGPVLLDLPMDVQRMTATLPEPTRRPSHSPDASRVAPADVKRLLEMLNAARRPLVLVGGGVRIGRAAELCRRALEHLGVPVVHSLMGLDVLGSDHPLRVGMIGSYGNRWANHALGECDALLVIGSRLDIRQTGTETESFAQRPIVHVDVDAAEINNRVLGAHAIVADAKDFCAAVLAAPAPAPSPAPTGDVATWKTHLAEMVSAARAGPAEQAPDGAPCAAWQTPKRGEAASPSGDRVGRRQRRSVAGRAMQRGRCSGGRVGWAGHLWR